MCVRACVYICTHTHIHKFVIGKYINKCYIQSSGVHILPEALHGPPRLESRLLNSDRESGQKAGFKSSFPRQGRLYKAPWLSCSPGGGGRRARPPPPATPPQPRRRRAGGEVGEPGELKVLQRYVDVWFSTPPPPPTHTHLPAQVLCLGTGLCAEVSVADLLLY